MVDHHNKVESRHHPQPLGKSWTRDFFVFHQKRPHKGASWTPLLVNAKGITTPPDWLQAFYFSSVSHCRTIRFCGALASSPANFEIFATGIRTCDDIACICKNLFTCWVKNLCCEKVILNKPKIEIVHQRILMTQTFFSVSFKSALLSLLSTAAHSH